MSNQFTYKDQQIHVGDRIEVHQKIEEEGKTRTQLFEGLVIATKGRDVNQTFIVRKIGANNIGIERIFPLMSPNIEKIVVKAQGDVRRAKLYYLRGRTGRLALRVKEKKAAKK
jgi:large subunit ribosomal protein L19